MEDKLRLTAVVFCLLSLMTMSLAHAGQTGKVAGMILDKDSGEPLPGANVVIKAKWVADEEVETDHPSGAASNMDGKYFIINLQPGLYTLKVMYIGYNSVEKTRVEVDIDKTTRVDFKLEHAVLEGEQVSIIAYKPDQIEVDLTATKQTYTVSEIEDIAGVRDIQDVINLQADVVDNHFRGGRSNETQYLVAGSSIVNPLDNSSAYTPLIIGMQQVEVYTSGFSAEYGNAQSGVVNMVPKEGGSKWETKIKVDNTLARNQYWGDDLYSMNITPWNIVNDPETWSDLSPDGERMFFEGTGFDQYLVDATRADSLKIAQAAYRQYLSLARLLGGDYRDTWSDYQVQLSTGGPISKNVRIFIAGGLKSEPGPIPFAYPSRREDLMVNLSYYMGQNDKLHLGYDYNSNAPVNLSPKISSLFAQELKMRTLLSKTINYRLRWEHVFSPAAFMNLNFGILDATNDQVIPVLEPGVHLPQSAGIVLPFYNSFGSGYTSTGFLDSRSKQKVMTYSIDANITNQITQNNLIKAGIQFNYFDLYEWEESRINSNAGDYVINELHNYPYEGALYFQDKMEFEGLIANLGLRYDFYDFNANYYADIFSPTRNPNYDPSVPYCDRENYLDAGQALRESAKIFSMLEPRIGISYPISEGSVFHLNYGQFVQRPGLSQVFRQKIDAQGNIQRLGNPRIKPERTNSYDFGLVQGLPMGIRLDVSAYYKDVKDLVQQAIYIDENENAYITYANRDYANIKGFHVSLEKTGGSYQMIVRYRYQSATGKTSASDEEGKETVYLEKDRLSGDIVTDFPDPEDVPLDYERRHRLIVNFTYRSPENNAPDIFGFRPLANFLINFQHTYMTGRPYTYWAGQIEQRYNKRTPDENETKLKIEKSFRSGKYNIAPYFTIYNLMNQRVYNYALFSNPINEDLKRWETGGLDAAKIDDSGTGYPLYIEPGLFNNKPRYYQIGLNIRF